MENKVKLFLSLLVCALPLGLRAQFFGFTTNADNTITITSYNGPGGAVTIPATINTLPVTVIGQNSFNGKTSVTGVSIPNSVTNIGGAVFEFCSGLNSVTLGNGIESIGSNAFFDCPALTNIALPVSVTNLGNLAFGACGHLTNIGVNASNPSFVSSNGVLFDASQTTLIAFPGGATGSYLVPSNVAAIAYGAFFGALNLASVTISSNVTNIGLTAFVNCSALTNISVDPSNTEYSSSGGVLFDKPQATLIQCPGGMTGSYSVPGSVNTIGMSAFAGCGQLSAINLSAGVTIIQADAFDSCTSLTGFTIPPGITNIPPNAFVNCSHLAAVSISEGVQNIGNTAFILCGSLKQVVLSASVTSIGLSAFSQCTSLTNVTIMGNVTNIGQAAFLFASSLQSVYFAGNAPPTAPVAFEGDPTTVYYLPTATGWSTNYSGVPAVLWDPQAQSPRIDAGQFQFDITGPSNSAVVIVASADLANPVWIPLATNALSASGTSTFTDAQSGAYAQRFYRFRSP